MDYQKPVYFNLVKHYESCFMNYGATPKGVDWPKKEDVVTRFNIMIEMLKPWLNHKAKLKLLDLGCGYGALYGHLLQLKLVKFIDYSGIDLSLEILKAAKTLYPDIKFSHCDLLGGSTMIEDFDFIIMNGLFTVKSQMTQPQMFDFFSAMLDKVYRIARIGLSFNIMSTHVDWLRDDLFHVSFDKMAEILQKVCGRHFVFRADYGLYEYTVYVYKKPRT